MSFIKAITNYIKTIWHWFGEAKIAGMCILYIALALFFSLYACPSELSIRSSGFALQLLGMILAIFGLLDVRQHFGQDSLLKIFYDWLVRFPKWRRKADASGSMTNISASSLKGRAEGGDCDDPELPIEKRIERILNKLEKLKTQQHVHDIAIKDIKISHKELKDKVEKDLKNMKDEVYSDAESVHTNGLMLALVGLIWVAVGITMSTLSQEIYGTLLSVRNIILPSCGVLFCTIHPTTS